MFAGVDDPTCFKRFRRINRNNDIHRTGHNHDDHLR